MLTREQCARIEAAVGAAESRTSGEIVVVLAQNVSQYREVPLAYAAGAALAAPALAAWLGLSPSLFGDGWIAAHQGASDAMIGWAIAGYAATQAAMFALVYLAAAWSPVRRAITPAWLKRERAHKAALAQFLATGLDGSPTRTGVLIFAALDDHVVEVVADSAIHEKVGPGAWDEAIQAMRARFREGAVVEGLETGVSLCGAALARHFPHDGGAPNALPNAPRLI